MWKQDGSSHMVDCLLTYGVSETPEEALMRIEHSLVHGRSRPPQSAAEFRRMAEGGTFFLYGVHLCLPVPRQAFTDPDAIKRLHQKALII